MVKSDADEIYGGSVYIMNEYFQQLKCKKEGLCVYAVLRVNLFIAKPQKKKHRKESQKPLFVSFSTASSSCERCRLERRTTANYVIFFGS